MIKLAQLCWTNSCAHVLESIGTIYDGCHDLIDMTDCRIGDQLVLQLHSVGKMLTTRILDITLVGAAMLG